MDSGLVTGDKVPQLLDDGVNELLLVTLVLAELSEHVVFPTRILHPTESERGKENKRERVRDYINKQNRIKEKSTSLSDLDMHKKLHQMIIWSGKKKNAIHQNF